MCRASATEEEQERVRNRVCRLVFQTKGNPSQIVCGLAKGERAGGGSPGSVKRRDISALHSRKWDGSMHARC